MDGQAAVVWYRSYTLQQDQHTGSEGESAQSDGASLGAAQCNAYARERNGAG